MFSGVAVAVPTMGEELSMSATALGLVETLFLAGSVAFLLPLGRLADATDRGRLYKLGLLAFGLSSALIGVLAASLPVLLVRFFQGACSAVLSATGAALLADLVPAERRGRAYGASIGTIYAGLTLGPILAGVLVDTWGWRAVFFFGGGLLLLMYAMVETMLPSSWRRPGPVVHLPSAALVLGAVLLLVFGTANMADLRLGPALLAAGVLTTVVFVILQRRLERPLLDVRALVRHRVLRTALLVQLLLYMSAFCSVFMLSIYLQTSLGHPAQTAGMVLSVGAVLMAVTAPLAGALADRLRPRVIASVGVALVLISSIIATQLGPSSSLTHVIAVLIFQGLGFGLFSSPNMTIVMNSVEQHELSMASALGAKSRSLGMISGMLVTSLLISLHYRGRPLSADPQAFVTILVTCFTVLTVLDALALLAGVISRESRGA